MRIKSFFIIYLSVYFIFNCWLVFQKPFGGFYNDDGLYLVLGKSLASGYGYCEIDNPDHPVHTTVPFLYPLILSAFFHFSDFPENVAAIKLLNVFLAVITFYFLFEYYSAFMSEICSSLFTVFCSLNFFYLIHMHCVMTETLFVLLSVSHFYAFRKKLYLSASFLLIMAFYTRASGIILIFTSLFYMPFLNSAVTLFLTSFYFIYVYFVKYLTSFNTTQLYFRSDYIHPSFNIRLFDDLSSLFLIPGPLFGFILFAILILFLFYSLYYKIRYEYEFTYIFIYLMFFLLTVYGTAPSVPRYLSAVLFIFLLYFFKFYKITEHYINNKFKILLEWVFFSFTVLHLNVSVNYILSNSSLYFDTVLFSSYVSASRSGMLSGTVANHYHRLFYLLSGLSGSEDVSECDCLLDIHRSVIYSDSIRCPDTLRSPFPEDYQIIFRCPEYTLYKLNKG